MILPSPTMRFKELLIIGGAVVVGALGPLFVITEGSNMYQAWEAEQFEERAYVSQIADSLGLDRNLVLAVIKVESNFDSHAISYKGAKGLMQLCDGTAREVGVDDAFDPQQNIRGGSAYLAGLLQRFSTLDEALAAYNAGPERLKEYGGVPPFPRTNSFLKDVKRFKKLYAERVDWD